MRRLSREMFWRRLLLALNKHIIVLSLILFIQSCGVLLFLIQLIQQYKSIIIIHVNHIVTGKTDSECLNHFPAWFKFCDREQVHNLRFEKAVQDYNKVNPSRLLQLIKVIPHPHRTHAYNILKQSNRPPWKYHKLFTKQKPTEEEQMFKQFLNHCATTIQSTFKKFIKQRQYKTARRIHINMTKWIVSRKTRKVYNCKSMIEMRKRFVETNAAIEQAIQNGKPIGALQKQSDYLLEVFNQQFQSLYTKGRWIYEEHTSSNTQIKILNKKAGVDERPIKQAKKGEIIEDERPIKGMSKDVNTIQNKTAVINREIKPPKQKQQTSSSNMIPNINNSKPENQDERPLNGNSKGAYNFDDKPITPSAKQIAKSEPQPLGSQQIVQTEAPQNPPKHKRLMRKQVYDPRKAIANQKQQKKLKTQTIQKSEPQIKIKKQQPKQKQEEEERTIRSQLPAKETQVRALSIDNPLQKTPIVKKSLKEGLKNQREKYNRREKPENRSIENLSAIKDAKSRIDCWNKPADPRKKRQIQEAYYEEASDIQDNYVASFKNLPRQGLKERMARKINKICENLKHHRVRKQKKQKNEDPQIGVLERVYEDQYSKRFNQLKPKLEKLLEQRQAQSIQSVPYLLCRSQYSIAAGQSVSTDEYYEMQKQIIINYEHLKRL